MQKASQTLIPVTLELVDRDALCDDTDQFNLEMFNIFLSLYS